MAYIEYNGYDFISEEHNAILDSIGNNISVETPVIEIAAIAAEQLCAYYAISGQAKQTLIKSILADGLNHPQTYSKTLLPFTGYFKELAAIAEPPTLIGDAEEFGDYLISVTDKVRALGSSEIELVIGLSFIAIYRGSAYYWQTQLESTEAPWHGFFPSSATFASVRDVAKKDAYGAVYGLIGGGIQGAIGGAIAGAITGPGVIVSAGAGLAGGLIGGFFAGAVVASLAAVAEKQEKEK